MHMLGRDARRLSQCCSLRTCPLCCAGVWADLTEVYPDLVAQLNAFGAGTERDLKITGHSLGGILSGLTAARLAADGVNVSGGLPCLGGGARQGACARCPLLPPLAPSRLLAARTRVPRALTLRCVCAVCCPRRSRLHVGVRAQRRQALC